MGGAAADSGHTGTLDYLAPEQIRGEAVDAGSDCYALACILYECLAGEPPFRRQSEAETLWAQLRDEPQPLRAHPALQPECSHGARRGEGRALRAPLAALIEGAACRRGVRHPGRAPAPAMSRELVRRRRVFLVAGAVVLTAAVAAAILALSTGGDPDPQPGGNTLVAIDTATPTGSSRRSRSEPRPRPWP